MLVIDDQFVHRHRPGGRERTGLPGTKVECRAVLAALDLAFVGPHLAISQRVLLVAAAVPHGKILIGDADQGDPEAGHVEPLYLPWLEVIAPAQTRRLRHRGPPSGRPEPGRSWLGCRQWAPDRRCRRRTRPQSTVRPPRAPPRGTRGSSAGPRKPGPPSTRGCTGRRSPRCRGWEPSPHAPLHRGRGCDWSAWRRTGPLPSAPGSTRCRPNGNDRPRLP